MRTKLIILPLLLIFLVTLVNPKPLQAEVRPTLSVVGQIGGVANVSVASGGQLYINIGPRVAKLSLAANLPGAPVYSPMLAGIPQDLKVANGFVYVALGAGGVAILNASTLAVVAQQALPPDSSPAVAVAVGTQRLFLAAGESGIQVYTLAADHKTLGWAQAVTFTPAENITDVEVRTLTASGASVESLLASSNNFDVRPGAIFRFNLTANPTVLGAPALTSRLPMVTALSVTNQFVYATAFDARLYALDAWLLGTSASISRSVSLVDALGGPAIAYQVAVDANERTAYVSSQSQGLEVVNLPASLATTAPTQLTATVTANAANAIAPVVDVTETVLYIADALAGLSIAEVPAANRAVVELDHPSYLAPQPANTTLVAGTNGQAFALSNGTDLWTINSSVPAALSRVGDVQPPTRANINAMVVVTGTSLILSAGGDLIFDYQLDGVGVPTGGTVVGNPDLNDNAYQTVVSGTNAFVADGPAGLAVVDLRDRDALTVTARTASVPGTSNYTNVEVLGQYAYLVDVLDGVEPAQLRVYDVSTPAAPVEVAATGADIATLCGADAGVNDLKAAGTHLYLACGANGVRGVEVSTPAAPTPDPAASYATPGNAQALALGPGALYVADGPAGVAVLTRGGSGQLSLGSRTALPDFAERVAVADNGTVYVGTNKAGLEILQSVPMTYLFLPILRH